MTTKRLIRMIDTVVMIWWAFFLSIRLSFPKYYPTLDAISIATILLVLADGAMVHFADAYEPKDEHLVHFVIRTVLLVFPLALSIIKTWGRFFCLD